MPLFESELVDYLLGCDLGPGSGDLLEAGSIEDVRQRPPALRFSLVYGLPVAVSGWPFRSYFFFSTLFNHEYRMFLITSQQARFWDGHQVFFATYLFGHLWDSRTFWLDQLCVDQTNSEMKSHRLGAIPAFVAQSNQMLALWVSGLNRWIGSTEGSLPDMGIHGLCIYIYIII